MKADTPSIHKTKAVRFNITLPEVLDQQLHIDAEKQGLAKSTLIAKYVTEHYATNEALERLETLEKECVTVQEQLSQERNQAIQRAAEQEMLVQGLQNQLKNATARTKSFEDEASQKDIQIAQLAQEQDQAAQLAVEQDAHIQDLTSKLKAEGENCQRTLTEQERRHQDIITEEEHRYKDITNALRHEQELTAAKLESLQLQLQQEREHNLELRTDKEQLQKQLELVTLRLPAPKEGFWARVFGRKKEVKQ